MHDIVIVLIAMIFGTSPSHAIPVDPANSVSCVYINNVWVLDHDPRAVTS